MKAYISERSVETPCYAYYKDGGIYGRNTKTTFVANSGSTNFTIIVESTDINHNLDIFADYDIEIKLTAIPKPVEPVVTVFK